MFTAKDIQQYLNIINLAEDIQQYLNVMHQSHMYQFWLTRKTTLSNILPRASMTKTNNKGDKWSACLNPLKLSKKPHGEPLIRIEKQTIDRRKKIHLLHLLEKPLRSSKFRRKPQFTWLKAFSTSSLQSNLGRSVFNLLSRHSLALSTRSKICLFRTKAFLKLKLYLPWPCVVE